MAQVALTPWLPWRMQDGAAQGQGTLEPPSSLGSVWPYNVVLTKNKNKQKPGKQRGSRYKGEVSRRQPQQYCKGGALFHRLKSTRTWQNDAQTGPHSSTLLNLTLWFRPEVASPGSAISKLKTLYLLGSPMQVTQQLAGSRALPETHHVANRQKQARPVGGTLSVQVGM